MNRLKILSIIACAMALAVYGLTGTTPANADIYPGLDHEMCMADAYGGTLNCTANDVEITKVIPIDADGDRSVLPDGTPNPEYDSVECTSGQTFSLNADITVRTNANERYDTTFYLPLTEKSPMELQGGAEACSLVLPIPNDEPDQLADVDIDKDQCGDISKAYGPDQYVLSNETITMLCSPSPDDPTKAEFTYCAAWDNISRDNCTAAPDSDPYPGQVPGTKSKCNCDSFPIDVFIRPPAPDIVKSAGTPATRTEPGGEYIFNISFTNPSPSASLFITGLTDEVDDNADGSYETSLNLWGALTNPVPTTDGVYLVASTCPSGAPYELAPSGTYSCSITVHIVDSDLPNDQSPELYNDVIKVVLQDKNGDSVGTGETCPAGLTPGSGDNCSAIRQVNVTNVAPIITVTKTPSVDEVLEPGGDVTFTIEVTSSSGSYDDPLTISSLVDSVFLDLDGQGTCAKGGSLYAGSPYTCSFTAPITGNAGYVHSDTVTAKATDNEGDEAQASDGATVNVNDVPSSITLEKTANPTEVDETGDDPTVYRDVAYTFAFSVAASGVDDITFSSLTDDKFGALTGDCMVTTKNGASIPPTPLNGFVLSPGDSASCVITEQLQGNADDIHTNLATISGTDEDGQGVADSDDATVTFLDTGLDITPEFAMKATAFVRLTNGSVDTATITGLTIKGVPLVAGGGIAGQFDILNEAANSSYSAGDGPYNFCAAGATILPGARYDCAFTLKLYPGFEAGDIALLATGVDGLVFTLEDDEGNPVSSTVGISIQTQE